MSKFWQMNSRKYSVEYQQQALLAISYLSIAACNRPGLVKKWSVPEGVTYECINTIAKIMRQNTLTKIR